MAQPRVFISSTFYDLRYVRNDLEQFVQTLGYEPVLNERGSVPYSKTDALENDAYREITNCDILVSIVGGRYGQKSEHSESSISQEEVKQALEMDKPVYFFVEKRVFAEYETYKRNKNRSSEIEFSSVDSVEIFEFLDHITSMNRNNPIAEFDGAGEIIRFLREQWAGLFQRLLQEQTRTTELELIQKLRYSAETMEKLLSHFSEKEYADENTMKEVLLFNHPAHQNLKSTLNARYPTFFTNKKEMEQFIAAKGYEVIDLWELDNPNWFEYIYRTNKNKRARVNVCAQIFDENGNLKVLKYEDWDDNWIYKDYIKSGDDEDEIPF